LGRRVLYCVPLYVSVSASGPCVMTWLCCSSSSWLTWCHIPPIVADFKGKWVVIMFTPAGHSLTAADQLISLNDNLPRFKQFNSEVIVVSPDSKFVFACVDVAALHYASSRFCSTPGCSLRALLSSRDQREDLAVLILFLFLT
jgi:hypothetical protein